MRRIYGDGRHHLMEASPRSTPAHPFTLPSNELRHSRTKFNRSFLSLSPLFPLPSFSLVSPCSPVRRFSPSLRSSVFVAPLPRAPFAGTAFFYLCICLSVHAFTDLHLGNTARSFYASLPLLYCTLLYFDSRCSFIFIRVRLTHYIFLCSTYSRSVFIHQIFPKFPEVSLLLLYSPSTRVFTRLFSSFPWSGNSLTSSLPLIYLK